MRAFLKSSEGCFQLKQHTTTIGRHEASDIVLQVGARKPNVIKTDGGLDSVGYTATLCAKHRGYQLAAMYSKERGAWQISNKT